MAQTPSTAAPIPPAADREGSTRAGAHRRVLSGAMVGMGGQVLNLATRFVLTPYVLATIGFEAFGFWAVLFLALGILGIHRIGFVGAAVSLVARHSAQGREDRIEATLRTTATIGAVFAVVVGTALWIAAPGVATVLGTSAELVPDAAWALRIATAATFASLILGGWQSTLEGLQRYAWVRSVDTVCSLLEAGLIWLMLHQGFGLPGLGAAFAFRVLAPLPVHRLAARRSIPGLNVWPGRIDRAAWHEMIRFGGSMQILGTIHLGIASVDRMALAQVLSMEIAGAFEVARKLVQTAAGLPMQALAPLVPAAAEAGVRANEETARLLRVATRAIAAFSALAAGLFVAAPEPVLQAWIGESRPDIAFALQVLALGGYVHLATGPTTSVLRGLTRPRAEFGYAIAWLVAGVTLIPLGAWKGGMAGAAVASATVQAGASLGLLWFAWPGFRLPRSALLRDVLLPGLCAVLPAVALRAVFGSPAGDGRWPAVWWLCGFGPAVLAATLAASWFLLLDAPGRRAISSRIARRFGRPRATAPETNPSTASEDHDMNPAERPRLSIVTVSYKSADAVLELLRSLREGGLDGIPSHEIVVVDSHSEDDTVERVRAAHPEVEVIACETNVGFAKGCNLGSRACRGDYLLLLNPDALAPPGSLARMVAWLDEHPGAAAAGPQLIGLDGQLQISTQRFPSLRSELSRQWEGVARLLGCFLRDAEAPTRPGPVDWVSGASLMIRRSVWEQVGPLDQRFFLYFEETDWCLRAHRAGHEIHFLPDVQVVHVGGVSARASGQVVRAGQAARFFRDSRWRYFHKQHGLVTAALVALTHRTREWAQSLHMVQAERSHDRADLRKST